MKKKTLKGTIKINTTLSNYYSTNKNITLDSLKNISNKPNVFYDKNSDGYYCGNQNDRCTEKGIEIPSETKNP